MAFSPRHAEEEKQSNQLYDSGNNITVDVEVESSASTIKTLSSDA